VFGSSGLPSHSACDAAGLVIDDQHESGMNALDCCRIGILRRSAEGHELVADVPLGLVHVARQATGAVHARHLAPEERLDLVSGRRQRDDECLVRGMDAQPPCADARGERGLADIVTGSDRSASILHDGPANLALLRPQDPAEAIAYEPDRVARPFDKSLC
jgi:hypothetical protein